MNVIKARKKGSDEVVRVEVTQTHAELFGTSRAHRASPAQAKGRLVKQGYELVGVRQRPKAPPAPQPVAVEDEYDGYI